MNSQQARIEALLDRAADQLRRYGNVNVALQSRLEAEGVDLSILDTLTN